MRVYKSPGGWRRDGGGKVKTEVRKAVGVEEWEHYLNVIIPTDKLGDEREGRGW